MVQRWDLSPCSFQDAECVCVCVGIQGLGASAGGIPASNLEYLTRFKQNQQEACTTPPCFWCVQGKMSEIWLDQHQHQDAFKSNQRGCYLTKKY